MGPAGAEGPAGSDGAPAGPVITHISTLNSLVPPGGRVQVLVSAESPTGESLSYDWTLPEGWSSDSTDTEALTLTAPYAPGEQGQVTITVTDESGHSRRAHILVATTLPVAPQNLSAQSGDGSISLTWDPVAGAQGYHLYYATEPVLDPPNISAFDGWGIEEEIISPYLLDGLTNGTVYYAVVIAVTGSAESPASNEVSAMPVLPPNIATGLLNDTGIDWCTDGSSNFLDCPVAGYEGQDGDYGAGGFDFTKLGSVGELLSASATEWSCVLDNHTGLIWEVKEDDSSHLRYQGHTYTWYDPDSNTNGGNAGTEDGGGVCTGIEQCNIHAYAEAVNARGLCGANDWRLPDAEELLGITHKGRTDPAIDTDYFPNTESHTYWTSSPYAGNNNFARYVAFSSGGGDGSAKLNSYRVRLVRGGQ